MNRRLPALDPLLHQPVRTQIVAFLSGRGTASFSELKRTLGITDGNLGAHLHKLIEARLVEAREEPSAARSHTVFFLTDTGRAALTEYIAHLAKIVRFSAGVASERPLAVKPNT